MSLENPREIGARIEWLETEVARWQDHLPALDAHKDWKRRAERAEARRDAAIHAGREAVKELRGQRDAARQEVAQLKDQLSDESLGGCAVRCGYCHKPVNEPNSACGYRLHPGNEEKPAGFRAVPECGCEPDYRDVDISRAYMDGYVQAVADVRVGERFLEAAKALAEKKERGSG